MARDRSFGPSTERPAVKLLRIWFVVLLTVLLPVRGAMAATMLCAPGGGAAHHELQVAATDAGHDHELSHDSDRSHDDHAGAHDHASVDDGHAPHAHDHAPDGGDPAPDPTHPHASHDKCNFCSASCSTPPLPSAPVSLAEPVALAEAVFPDLCVPAPSFESDGQERPPRTC